MKLSIILGRSVAVLTLGCGLGFAPVALAQTAGGTMAPMATTVKPVAKKFPKADEFKTVADATSHCPGDTVVWSTLAKSHSFHLAGSPHYGKTKHGAYVCEKEALSYGFHQAKN